MTQQQLGQSLNPAMLLQMQSGNAMQANIGGGMNGVNQGALNMTGMGNMANASVAGMGGMNANAMSFNSQHLAQLQQMTPQQIEARQMQAKLSVGIIESLVFAVTNSFYFSFLPIFRSSATTHVAAAATDGANGPGATTVRSTAANATTNATEVSSGSVSIQCGSTKRPPRRSCTTAKHAQHAELFRPTLVHVFCHPFAAIFPTVPPGAAVSPAAEFPVSDDAPTASSSTIIASRNLSIANVASFWSSSGTVFASFRDRWSAWGNAASSKSAENVQRI
jgi:hypothetical protein